MKNKLKWHHRFLREVACTFLGHKWKCNPHYKPWSCDEYHTNAALFHRWHYKCRRCRNLKDHNNKFPKISIFQQLRGGLSQAFYTKMIQWQFEDAVKYGKYNSKILAALYVSTAMIEDFVVHQEWMYSTVQELFYEIHYKFARYIFKDY